MQEGLQIWAIREVILADFGEVLCLNHTRKKVRKTKIPTLPVAKGIKHTKVKTLIYTASLKPLSLLPSIYGIAGQIYFISALILRSLYLILSLKIVLSKKPKGVFLIFYSVLYIALLFSVMVFDMRR